MAIDALIAPFQNVALFRGLGPRQIEEIAQRAERVVYRPGDVILDGGNPCHAAILIASGEAVVAGGYGMMQTAEPVPAGSLLDEMAMLIETEHNMVVVARTTVRALKIPRVQMHALMIEDPSIAEHFFARITARLTEFVDGFRQIERSLSRPDVRRPSNLHIN